MTLSQEDREWREAKTRGEAAVTRRDGKRFAPLNALVDGGWLGILTTREVKVWVVLHRLADGNGMARVSHGTIAARSGMRREHAARTTKRLEDRGLLRVRVRGRTMGKCGKRTSNEYEMLSPPPVPNSATGGTIEDDE
jgi:CRP-like cAMP-binding protein